MLWATLFEHASTFINFDDGAKVADVVVSLSNLPLDIVFYENDHSRCVVGNSCYVHSGCRQPLTPMLHRLTFSRFPSNRLDLVAMLFDKDDDDQESVLLWIFQDSLAIKLYVALARDQANKTRRASHRRSGILEQIQIAYRQQSADSEYGGHCISSIIHHLYTCVFCLTKHESKSDQFLLPACSGLYSSTSTAYRVPSDFSSLSVVIACAPLPQNPTVTRPQATTGRTLYIDTEDIYYYVPPPTTHWSHFQTQNNHRNGRQRSDICCSVTNSRGTQSLRCVVRRRS